MSQLSVRDIHTYYGQSHVLQGVSLEVEASETVALLGRNGAGKTTTFRSIMGLTPPRRGSIEFNGTEIQGAEPYDISRRGIGYVPEERRVFPELTVADNIGVVLDSDSSWSREDLYEIFPKLDELSNSLGQHLSGGEQQMLAIARALATDPSLLILDEPSEGLAPNIVEDLRVNLNNVIEQRDITVLIAEQNAKFAFDVADKASILSKGSVVWDGAIPELEADSELVGKYLSVEEL